MQVKISRKDIERIIKKQLPMLISLDWNKEGDLIATIDAYQLLCVESLDIKVFRFKQRNNDSEPLIQEYNNEFYLTMYK